MHATSGTDDKARVGDAFPTLELAATSCQLVTVPDPAGDYILYRRLGVERRPGSLLSPGALGAAIAGQATALRNHSAMRGALGPVNPTGGRLGLPADFLIAPDGRRDPAARPRSAPRGATAWWPALRRERRAFGLRNAIGA